MNKSELIISFDSSLYTSGKTRKYPNAKENMQKYIEYILYEKKNQQAAASLLDDFEYTKDILAEVAGSLKLCDNEKLRSLGYRRIGFKLHRYFMLYRVEDTTVYIDGIFHELQDFENKIN